MKQYLSPTGAIIKGTLEATTGVAMINGIDDKGVPEYEGSTDYFYDNQETVTRNGKIIFVDYNGEEWTFDQLTPMENEDEDVG